jgi:hypothetical protein
MLAPGYVLRKISCFELARHEAESINLLTLSLSKGEEVLMQRT